MIKLGIIGYKRGRKIIEIIDKTDLNLKVEAIYDPYLKKINKKIKIYKNEKDFYRNTCFKNVYIASPVKLHPKQTISALKNNKNVLCEVPAFTKINDGKKIYKILRKKKLIYSMAENYLFVPQHIALEKLIRKDYFGEITYIRSSYIHDCKKLSYDEKTKKLTWRGLERIRFSGNDYPTHSIAPPSNFLKLNQKNYPEKLKFIESYSTKEISTTEFFKKNKNIHKKYKFKRPDISLSKITTDKKTIIDLICDTTSNRPSSMVDLYIQGSKGAYISGRHDNEQPIIYNKNYNTFKKFNYKKLLSNKDRKNLEKLGKLFPLYKTLKYFEECVSQNLFHNKLDFNNSYVWSSIVEKSMKSIKLKRKVKI